MLDIKKKLTIVNTETDSVNLGTHVVTSSFKPASQNSKTASHTQFLIVCPNCPSMNTFAYELHLFKDISNH